MPASTQIRVAHRKIAIAALSVSCEMAVYAALRE
jgi:hypothetical protein